MIITTPLGRRNLLRSAAATGLLLSLGRGAWAVTGDQPAPKRLVVIMLRGAVDGLNVTAPYRDAAYRAARPTIALQPPGSADGVLDLDGYFGLHPALAALMPLWQSRQLAFVQAAGSPDPSRSHFNAQDFMETGTPGQLTTQDGWMNRLVGVLPGTAGPTRAISVGPRSPRILAGKQPSASVTLTGDPGKAMATDRPAVSDAFSRLYDGNDGLSRAYREGTAAHRELVAGLTTDTANQQDAADHQDPTANNGAAPPSGFPLIAARLAQLLTNDSNVSLAFADLGGWDTHINQGGGRGQLANHLKPLGDGLARLAHDLGPLLKDTVILVMSEFGRTLHETGGGGTDHGHGNAIWAIGGDVAGGRMHGEWPGLDTASLYQGRDLAVTTDFRSVVSVFLERHLRLSDGQLAAVFPSMPQGHAGLAGLALG